MIGVRFFAILALVASTAVAAQRAHAQDWIYPIAQGDTLWSLCLEHTNKPGCWQELGKYNGITADRKITVDTEIRIPVAWLTQVPEVGEVIALSGEVFYDARSDGSLKPAQRGQSLSLGSTVSVVAGSATIQLIYKGEIVMRAGSKLTLQSMSTRKGIKGVSELKLQEGEVEIDVAPERNSRFEVTTPSAIAAVRGTQYRLAASESTRGEVIDGAVAVESGSTAVVAAGFGVLARKGEPVSEPRKLLPAPVFTQSDSLVSMPYTLSWDEQVDAVSWRIDVYADALAGALITTHDLDEPSLSLTSLEIGCYQLILRAIDAEGFNGMPSATRLCVEPAPPAPPPETPNYWKAFVTTLAFMLIVVL